MKSIGIFGGSFNPVHNGHVKIAHEAMNLKNLDTVIFVPAKTQPFKMNEIQESGIDRYNMLLLAICHEPRFTASRIELDREGVSYSYITAEFFKALYPNDKLYFILGDEAYAQLDSWKEPQRLRKAVDFIVVSRKGGKPPKNLIYVDIPHIDISSTDIRKCVSNGESIKELVPDAVLKYITEHNLYNINSIL